MMAYNYEQDSSNYYGKIYPNVGFSTGGNPSDVQFSQYYYGDATTSQSTYGGSGGMPQSNYSYPQTYFNPANADQRGDEGFSSNGMGFGGGTGMSGEGYEDEPPLLEELGINFNHIWQKTQAVLNPWRNCENEVLCDTDLAGPLVFCLAFGGTLLLMGKLHFSYIYGLGLIGCIAMYALMSLMSPQSLSLTFTMSTLGYCLLPMVLLSSAGIFLSLKSPVGFVLTGVIVLWCSAASSKLFVMALKMHQQRILVAYPCALVYGVFALLTVF